MKNERVEGVLSIKPGQVHMGARFESVAEKKLNIIFPSA
jgi:hypothetical protein